MMMECDLDTPAPEWVIEHPETLALFEELGIDYCCGGKSLAYACQERGLQAEAVLERIVQTLHGKAKPMLVGNLASVQVGLPQERGEVNAANPMDRAWTTGFFKEPVMGPVWLGRTNLDGDGQADLVHHGGPDKAVLAYSGEHYDAWRRELKMPSLPLGGFGENFTVAGLTEAEICIGDVWKVGDQARVQVSQPRQPCWKLARRWRIKTLAYQVQKTGRTGWYFRVLSEGTIAAGMPLDLVERPHPAWTVARANQLMHVDKSDLAGAAELAALPPLSESWRRTLTQRAEKNINPDPATRLTGENS